MSEIIIEIVVGIVVAVSAGLILKEIFKKREKTSEIIKNNKQFSNNYETKAEKEHEDDSIDETIILDNGENQIYSYDLEKGDKIVGKIEADQPINVFVVSNYGLRLFKKGEDFNFEDGGEKIKRIKINFETYRGGPWHVVIENEDYDNTEVNVYLNRE